MAVLVRSSDVGTMAGAVSHSRGVAQECRGEGVGAQLLAAAEAWVRSQGCVEMASDTQIENELSQRVHESLRFEVVHRCVHYRKSL